MEPDRHQQELALLHNISRIVDQSIDMRSVVHPVLEALATTLGFRMATITRSQAKHRCVRLRVSTYRRSI